MPERARPGYSTCPTCGAEVLRTVDRQGEPHVLDLYPATYMIVGNVKDGTPCVVQSGGYVVHVATCRGNQTA